MVNWNRIFAGLAFLLLPIATFAQLDLRDRLTAAQIPKNSGSVLFAATPSQTYPCVEDLKVSGVKFTTVGFDSKTKQVKYLFVSDEQFRTREGLRVDDWIQVSEDQVVSISGWNIYGPKTKDGWHIVLGSALLGGKITFRDGTVLNPSASPIAPSKFGWVQIRAFEKGGV